jgi:zinc D-Ala-D-Ala carboxypeptidase
VGAGSKQGSVKIIFVDPVKRRRRRLLLVAALVLVCLFGLGYARLGMPKEEMTSLAGPAGDEASPAENAPHSPAVEEKASPAEKTGASTRKREGVGARPAHLSATAEICDDERVLVDRSHTLPPDYVPKDLVSLPDNGVPTLGGREMSLRREATAHLSDLTSAAAADGEELVVAPAFRSYADQQVSHARLKSIYGARADAMSATPGHSQHQLGTAVDFTNAAAAYQVKRRFGYTSASAWLQENATDHGFVLAYPPGGDESGYRWEPWHYRYVGVHNAERLERSGLSLQGFLQREGVLPKC